MNGPVCVLDASAVVALALNERGAATVGTLIQRSAVSAVTLAEALSIVKDRGASGRAVDLTRDLQALGLQVIDFGAEHAIEMAMMHDAGQALGPADWAGIATAIIAGLPLVTDDPLTGTLHLGRPCVVRAFR